MDLPNATGGIDLSPILPGGGGGGGGARRRINAVSTGSAQLSLEHLDHRLKGLANLISASANSLTALSLRSPDKAALKAIAGLPASAGGASPPLEELQLIDVMALEDLGQLLLSSPPRGRAASAAKGGRGSGVNLGSSTLHSLVIPCALTWMISAPFHPFLALWSD